MSKKAIYYDEAKRLYVQQGIGLDAIAGMLEDNVTRRTLHNWKTDGRWDDKRKRYLEEHESLQNMVMEIAKTAAKNALEKPTPKNLLALVRALSALNQKDALDMLSGEHKEDEKESKEDVKKIVTESIKEIMGA